MIYVLHGPDDLSKKRFLDSIIKDAIQEELIESNTVKIQGSEMTIAALEMACNTIPFMADKRLVIVEKFLAQFDDARKSRSRTKSAKSSNALAPWDELGSMLGRMPVSTVLIFLEYTIRTGNPILKQISDVVEVWEFPYLTGQKLEDWIRQKVVESGGNIEARAVRRLIDLIGGNLWIMNNEVEKLVLYAKGALIDQYQVDLLVTNAREANIFRAIDAILDGRTSVGINLINALLLNGADVSYVLAMLARQLRLIILAQDLRAQGVARSDLGRRLGLNADFVVRQTENHALRHKPERVFAMYRRLLDADLAIKTGRLSGDLALEILVADLGSKSG